MELCPEDLKSEMEIFCTWQWFFWCHEWSIFPHREDYILFMWGLTILKIKNIKKKQQMTEFCSLGRADEQGVKWGKSWKDFRNVGFGEALERCSTDSVSHVVPKFRTTVREWNLWVENIQELGVEDSINATRETGLTKLNIEGVQRAK